MVLIVNGQDSRVAAATVQALLAELGYDEALVAVAVNQDVVRRKDWAETGLTEGDRVEILTPRQGG